MGKRELRSAAARPTSPLPANMFKADQSYGVSSAVTLVFDL